MPNARKDISREKELTLAPCAQESTRKLVMVRAETVLRVNSPLEQLVRARAAWLEDTDKKCRSMYRLSEGEVHECR